MTRRADGWVPCDCRVCTADRWLSRLGIVASLFALSYFALHVWLVRP